MPHHPANSNTTLALDRRAFLRVAPLTAAGLGLVLLNACQPAPTSSPSGATPVSKSATTGTRADPAASGYPVSVPDTLSPKPDLPSTGTWIDNAYNNYPANPTASATEAPARGGSMTYFNQAVYPPASALENNRSWQ
jgi:hypothetical protein